MIIRFRGKDGNFRINAEPTDILIDVIAELEKQLPPHGALTLSATPDGSGEQANEKWKTSVSKLGIKHGDQFFITYESVNQKVPNSKPVNSGNTYLGDELDHYLSNKSGLIPREQNSLCTHGAKGMCEYCQPLEPWDEDYQQSKGIKHTSVHAWRKRINGEGKWLEEPEYMAVKNPKTGATVQPPLSITLQRQKFRMVDHVEFVSPKIVENFIEFWRQTNQQRVGFLIGKYSSYETHVPLGIKAEVHFIWEPQQSNDLDSLMMQELPTAQVNTACSILGLEVIGVVFTDLLDQGTGDGKVFTKRHLNSYFLSGLEVALAARLQNEYPHYLPTNNGPGFSGPLKFSSRFVTCCVSGNEFGDIDVACYQVSQQAEALVRAGLVVPSANPAYIRVQEATSSKYAPDISYRRINEYKLTVTENAKPSFPLEYLLVSLSHGFKSEPKAASDAEVPEVTKSVINFPIENRPSLRGQTPSQLVDALQLSHGINAQALREFHVLLYLLDLGVLQKEEEQLLAQLLEVVKSEENESKIYDLSLQLSSGPGLNTLRMLAS